MPDDEIDRAVPGTPEFAAVAKTEFDALFARFKRQIRDGDDLFAVIFGCAHSNKEGVCFGMDAEPMLAINVMACALHQIAEQVYLKMRVKDKFLPKKSQTTYAKVLTDVIAELMQITRAMKHDINPNKPETTESGIITSPKTDGEIIS